MSNVFNSFFTSVAHNFVNKLAPSNKNFKDCLNDPKNNSFFATPVTPSEVHRQLLNLNEGKAPDAYDIPVKLIKCVSDASTALLQNLLMNPFNLAFTLTC